MDDWFILLGLIFYILFVMYAANQADAGLWSADSVRILLYSITAFLFVIGPLSIQAVVVSMMPENADLREQINLGQVAGIAVLALICASFGYNLIRTVELRQWLMRRMPGFNPESTVHQASILLVLLVLLLSLLQFVLNGGVNGVADSLDSSDLSPFATLFDTTLWTAAAFLGIGFAIRRNLAASLMRLGLRLPVNRDLSLGIMTGLILFGLSLAFTSIWQSLSDPQTFAEQIRAAEQLSNQLNSVPLILLVSAGAAIGEEIFMRGALQPIFGIGLTSGFFALLHNQYLLTPTLVFIFFVGVVFGQLRSRVSTTAAIIAHFVYNVAPFALVLLLGGTI